MNKSTKLNTFSIMMAYLAIMGFNAVTPAMNTFMNVWGETASSSTIYLISTLPLLVMCPVTIITGKLAGKYIKYKTLAVAGNLIYVIGGCAPVFLTGNLAVILICRAVFGIGIGITTPLGNALVLESFDEERSNRLLGYGTLIMNFGGILTQQLSGIFCSISWNLTFLSYACGLLPLIFSFFITEPEKKVSDSDTQEISAAHKTAIPAAVWILSVSILLLNTANISLMMNVSILMANNKGIDSSVLSAITLSCFTVGGCIAGLVFGKLYRKFMRLLIPAAVILCIAGQLLLLYGPNTAVMSAGTLLIGFGFSITHTGVYSIIGNCVPEDKVSFSISIVMTFLNISGFLSTYYLALIEKIFGESLITSYYAAIAIYAVLAVFYFLYRPKKKNIYTDLHNAEPGL